MRTSEATIAWALIAGCCAGHPAEVTSATSAGATTPEKDVTTPVPAQEEFVAIDVEEAARRLWPRPGPAAYAGPDPGEQAALARLVGRMLTEGGKPSTLAAEARAAGFVVEGWALGGSRVLVAMEAPERRRGGGAYLVRVGSTSPVILQAPHAFFDLGTERIALAMFAEEQGWPRALFVNTIHRYVGLDGVKRKQDDAPADPCHNPDHLFERATEAALSPGVEVVQLHGFGDDEDGPGFAAVVSGGSRPASERARAVAAGLREVLGAVALFPEETDRLGATSNVQGQAVRAVGGAFVHVELSADSRRRLREDPQLRRRMAAALRAPGT